MLQSDVDLGDPLSVMTMKLPVPLDFVKGSYVQKQAIVFSMMDKGFAIRWHKNASLSGCSISEAWNH